MVLRRRSACERGLGMLGSRQTRRDVAVWGLAALLLLRYLANKNWGSQPLVRSAVTVRAPAQLRPGPPPRKQSAAGFSR